MEHRHGKAERILRMGEAEMSERREFVKAERMGDKARYSVTIPIEVDPLHARMDELEQRISDVNDANLYGLSQLEERIEKLEQRMDGKDDMDGEMLLAIGKRLCAVERKLNHKGVEQ